MATVVNFDPTGFSNRIKARNRCLWCTNKQVRQILFILLIFVRTSFGKYDSTSYTEYESYPPYCSIPEEMERRKIPVLNNVDEAGETNLLHVTAILRHGARTPWKAGLNCWDGYASDPETSQWDCNLTTFLAPPPPDRVRQEEGEKNKTNKTANEAMLLFEKRYDSFLLKPLVNVTNELDGTCQLGQLLLKGYEQELVNGKYIRDAYMFSTGDDHNQHMKLLDVSKNGLNDKHLWDSVYYRVDDDQRTLMSGQAVMRGMFAPELEAYVASTGVYPVVPLHTADRHRDIVDPNENICERLKEIHETSIKASGYKAIIRSAKQLYDFQKEILKVPDPSSDMDAIDCLMTTMCTDRPLPKSVNDYDQYNRSAPMDDIDIKYGVKRFQRLIDLETNLYGYYAKANDGEYSKLGMGPLWAEIMDTIYQYVANKTMVEPCLSLIAGHDTTLIPLLVSLGPNVWDGVWPPYASMMIIEIYAVDIDRLANKTIFPSRFAFRLLYNGQVITNRIKDCYSNQELCDSQVLLKLVSKFATREINCTRQHRPSIVDEKIVEVKTLASTSGGSALILILFLSSVIIGSLITPVVILRCCPTLIMSDKQWERHLRQRVQVTDNTDVSEIEISTTMMSDTENPKSTIV